MLGCCGPDEGIWIFIVADDELVGGGDKFMDVFERTAPNPLFSNFGKPAFHRIEPGTAGWREMQMVARSSPRPRAIFGVLCVA